jgi:hypothetical protein
MAANGEAFGIAKSTEWCQKDANLSSKNKYEYIAKDIPVGGTLSRSPKVRLEVGKRVF